MNVRVKQIEVINFKGLKRMTFCFGDGDNELRGTNGTGKTTIADAFFWCLYEKDSKGRSNFDIKRLDANGNPVMKESHSVTVTLSIDGENVKLTRRLEEDWVRRRGDSEETFKGNHVDREWDGVPVTKMEFDMKLASIADENVMKMTILPTYFLEQDKVFQRDFLIKMAGDIKPEDIIKEHPECAWIVESGKQLAELTKSISTDVNRIKKQIDSIPARIDENNRNMPIEEDWDALSKEVADKQEQIDSIDKQIADKAEAYNVQAEEQQNIIRKIGELNIEKQKRITELKSSKCEQNALELQNQQQLKSELVSLQASIANSRYTIGNTETEIADLQNKRAMMLHKYHEVQEDKFQMDENMLICPTCKQPLPQDKAEEKREELEKNWNLNHAQTLSRIVDEGKTIAKQIEDKQERIKQMQDTIGRQQARIDEISAMPVMQKTIEIKEDTEDYSTDSVIANLDSEIARLTAQRDTELKAPDNSFLNAQKSTLNVDIAKINAKLANREQIELIKKRNAELNEERNNALNEVATLEGKLNDIASYKRLYMTAVEDNVNRLFSFVKWKMYEQQINGGEKETCIAMVDGVPYGRSLNTADCINAGIDIINTIARYYNVHTPVIVDNSESIVTLAATETQTIRLVVDGSYNTLTKTI